MGIGLKAAAPSGTAAASGVDDRIARRNAWCLAVAQALAGGHAAIVFATGPLVGAELAPAAGFATLPVSCFLVATALGTLLAGVATPRVGRRPVFLVGAACGVLSGLLAAEAWHEASFLAYGAAMACGGLYAASTVAYRYAAADRASPAFRARAMAWVLGGGVLSAFLGPQVVEATAVAATGGAPPAFGATYLAQAGLAVPALALLALVDVPRSPGSPAAGFGPAARSVMAVIARPPVLGAILGALVAYVVMNAVMTATPLAMALCGHGLSESNLAIQWHVLAMFAPSFVTGAVVSRLGPTPVIAAGLLLLVVAATVNLSGVTVAHFWVALVLLGVGWNLAYVACSSILGGIEDGEAKPRVQALADFLILASLAAGSFAAGHLLIARGWEAVNLAVLVPLGLALVIVAGTIVASLTRRARA